MTAFIIGTVYTSKRDKCKSCITVIPLVPEFRFKTDRAGQIIVLTGELAIIKKGPSLDGNFT